MGSITPLATIQLWNVRASGRPAWPNGADKAKNRASRAGVAHAGGGGSGVRLFHLGSGGGGKLDPLMMGTTGRVSLRPASTRLAHSKLAAAAPAKGKRSVGQTLESATTEILVRRGVTLSLLVGMRPELGESPSRWP